MDVLEGADLLLYLETDRHAPLPGTVYSEGDQHNRLLRQFFPNIIAQDVGDGTCTQMSNRKIDM